MQKMPALAVVTWFGATVAIAGAAAPAPPAPVTPTAADAPRPAPATRAADMEPLLDGSIRYLPPPAPPWKLAGKTDDNRKVTFITEDSHGRIDITVDPQTRDVPPEFAKQMAMIIGKGIREDADRSGKTVLSQPRVIKDERFFLKVHDRFSDEHGIRERLQLYRVMGLNIVHVAVVAVKDTPDEARPIFDAGEALLDGMRLTRGAAPVVYPRNKLKIRPPIDWEETKQDVPNGAVVTYSDPQQPARQLIVRARVLPKAMREDAARRDAFLDRMVDAERRTPPFDKAKAAGGEQVLSGGAPREYLRQVRADAQAEGVAGTIRVQTRYFIVEPDVLVSLRSVSTAEDEEILKLADALAVEVKPSRE